MANIGFSVFGILHNFWLPKSCITDQYHFYIFVDHLFLLLKSINMYLVGKSLQIMTSLAEMVGIFYFNIFSLVTGFAKRYGMLKLNDLKIWNPVVENYLRIWTILALILRDIISYYYSTDYMFRYNNFISKE